MDKAQILVVKDECVTALDMRAQIEEHAVELSPYSPCLL